MSIALTGNQIGPRQFELPPNMPLSDSAGIVFVVLLFISSRHWLMLFYHRAASQSVPGSGSPAALSPPDQGGRANGESAGVTGT
jgi:hypothetical protein